MQRKIANLPLHYGSAPKWLFERQKKILREICRVIILEFGTEELLKRLSDPVWFQILGCISGFDWHSSGVTTTVTAALKEVFNKDKEFGIFVFGGKGKIAIKTPQEILNSEVGNAEELIFISRLTAKVDNSCIQDGYQIYHHTLFVDSKRNWCVIQQGMNTETRYARRYHWFNKLTSHKDKKFIIEPHSGISAQQVHNNVLNLIDNKMLSFQQHIVEYLNIEKPEQMTKVVTLSMPERHYITKEDYDEKKLYKIFCILKDKQVQQFSDILLTEGVGSKTLRALCLISEVIYGDPVCIRDPARFSFAFGGKDGHPYPVDKENYDKTLNLFKSIVDKAKLEGKEKLKILKFLATV